MAQPVIEIHNPYEFFPAFFVNLEQLAILTEINAFQGFMDSELLGVLVVHVKGVDFIAENLRSKVNRVGFHSYKHKG